MKTLYQLLIVFDAVSPLEKLKSTRLVQPTQASASPTQSLAQDHWTQPRLSCSVKAGAGWAIPSCQLNMLRLQ